MKTKVHALRRLAAVALMLGGTRCLAAETAPTSSLQAEAFARYPEASAADQGSLAALIHEPGAQAFLKDYEAWEKTRGPVPANLSDQLSSALSALAVPDPARVKAAYFPETAPAATATDAGRESALAAAQQTAAARTAAVLAQASAFETKSDDLIAVPPAPVSPAANPPSAGTTLLQAPRPRRAVEVPPPSAANPTPSSIWSRLSKGAAVVGAVLLIGAPLVVFVGVPVALFIVGDAMAVAVETTGAGMLATGGFLVIPELLRDPSPADSGPNASRERAKP